MRKKEPRKRPARQKAMATMHRSPDKKARPTVRIAVLDDSEFYNRLVTRQLQSYAESLALDGDREFVIESYQNPTDFFRNLKDDVELIYTDYYLGNGITGDDILRLAREKCSDCTVVILSQFRNRKTAVESIDHGADKFIFKDKNTLSKACFYLSDYLRQKYEA